jgi:hypothetical protein
VITIGMGGAFWSDKAGEKREKAHMHRYGERV